MVVGMGNDVVERVVVRLGERVQLVLFAGLEGKDDGDCALDVVAKRARRVVGMKHGEMEVFFFFFFCFSLLSFFLLLLRIALGKAEIRIGRMDMNEYLLLYPDIFHVLTAKL